VSSWENLSDEELLKMRICDLRLELGEYIEERVKVLYSELEDRGLKLRPKVYLGDEWFSPEGMVAIAVPFYLAHPRLMQLERKIMMVVEGGTPDWCQKLLRHEAGHTFDHGYRFSKRKKWRELFGSPSQDYAPETYRPRPYSKSFVRHLENWYAQAHPDEDFAETFAVWLSPEKDWRKEYAQWPMALSKLKYIEELATEGRAKAPQGEQGALPFSAKRMKTTLEKYYARRKKENAQDYPDFYDGDLKRIFNGSQDLPKRGSGAGAFMRKHRKTIIDSVSYWTREHKYTISGLVKKLTMRCDSLDLRVGKPEAETNLEVAAYLATLVTHYLFTGKFKRTV
jgi:hypothetical protein